MEDGDVIIPGLDISAIDRDNRLMDESSNLGF